jgi:hypothetical protein
MNLVAARTALLGHQTSMETGPILADAGTLVLIHLGNLLG